MYFSDDLFKMNIITVLTMDEKKNNYNSYSF